MNKCYNGKNFVADGVVCPQNRHAKEKKILKNASLRLKN
jgi:hypothetical protein